ncbi:hypothetical protein CR513_08224, partial [Mucuna pruriens]
MFQKVEINIPLLDAIKKIPKYAKFLKELGVHKRKKMKGGVEVGGIVLALTRNEDFTAGAQALPKKCRDPGIFSVPCTIDDYTFADAMLNLGASINVMPTSIYKSLNFDDLEPTGMTIYVVQPLGILEDVLVRVDKLIFPADFYEHFQLDNSSKSISNFAKDTDSIGCFGSFTKVADYDEVWEVHNISDSEDDNIDFADLSQKTELIKLLDQVCKHENPKCANMVEVQVAEIEKPFTAQVATMFTSENESAKGS